MAAAFALHLDHDGIALRRGTAAGAALAETRLDAPDLAEALARMRETVAAESGGDAAEVTLVLPDSQILYTEAAASGLDEVADAGRVRNALEGATPYRLDELVYDWRREGDRLRIAVVARETLQEAESFARMHGFASAGYLGAADGASFPGRPVFDAEAPPEGHTLGDGRCADPVPAPARAGRKEDAVAPPRASDTPSAPDGTAAEAPRQADQSGESAGDSAPEARVARSAGDSDRPEQTAGGPVAEQADRGAPAVSADGAGASRAEGTEPAGSTEGTERGAPTGATFASIRARTEADDAADIPPLAPAAPEVPGSGLSRLAAQAGLGPEAARKGRRKRTAGAAASGRASAPPSPRTDGAAPSAPSAPRVRVPRPPGEGAAGGTGAAGGKTSPRLRALSPARADRAARSRGAASDAATPARPALGARDEAESMTVFGARRIGRERAAAGGGRALGLALTLGLLGLMGLVALWSLWFGERSPEETLARATADAPVSEAATTDAPRAEPVERADAPPDTAADPQVAADSPADPAPAPLPGDGGTGPETSIADLPAPRPDPDAPDSDAPGPDAPAPDAQAPDAQAPDAAQTAPDPATEPAPTSSEPPAAPALPAPAPAPAETPEPAPEDATELAALPDAPPVDPGPEARAEPPGTVTADPDPLDPSAARASYAGSGIWQRAPERDAAPPAGGPTAPTQVSLEPLDRMRGPGTPPQGVRRDTRPAAPSDPLPAGSVLGSDGLVVPTPEGARAPGGYTLYSGAPPITPPRRPAGLVPDAAEGAPDASESAPDMPGGADAEGAAAPAPPAQADDPLADIRPPPRPADAIEEESALEDGAPEAVPEAADAARAVARAPPPTRPRARPSGLPEEAASLRAEAARAAQVAQEEAAAAAEALAEAEAAEAEAEAEAEVARAAARIEGATRLAVAQTREPRARPSNISQIAARAARQQPDRSERQATARATQTPQREAPQAAPAPDDRVRGPVVARSQRITPDAPSNALVARQATQRNALRMRDVTLIGVYGTSSQRRALVRLPSGRYVKVKVGDRVDGGRVAAIGADELRYIKSGRDHVIRMPSG